MFTLEPGSAGSAQEPSGRRSYVREVRDGEGRVISADNGTNGHHLLDQRVTKLSFVEPAGGRRAHQVNRVRASHMRARKNEAKVDVTRC